MLKLQAILTNQGPVYIKHVSGLPYPYRITAVRFDGETVTETFDKDWFRLEHLPQRVQVMGKDERVNKRFVLKNPVLADRIDDLELEFDLEEHGYFDYDGDEQWHLKGDLEQYTSLYNITSDVKKGELEDVEFDIEIVHQIDTEIKQVEIRYPAGKQRFVSEWRQTHITNGRIKRDPIDKILFPTILHPLRPGTLSRDEIYKIVRQHVKDNINNDVAKITSDYDFCFRVEWRVKRATPRKYTVDVNAHKKRARKKLVERTQTHDSVECFAMTNKASGYQNYPVISGLTADNDAELKAQLDQYLDDLMEHINQEGAQCTACNGNGMLWKPRNNS